MPALDPIIVISWEDETAPGRAEELPTDLRDRVMGITYTDKSRGADECTVKLFNGDLSLFDDPRLAEGNKLHLQWGYAYEMGPVRVVRIKSVRGWSTLELACVHDREMDFIASQRVRVWENSTLPEIAEEIAREMGFTTDRTREIEGVEIPVRYPGVVQTAETDYAFLQRIADREDYIFRIVGNVFHFHPPRLGDTPGVTLTYFDDDTGVFIGEPRLEKGTLGIPGRVTRRGHSNRERANVEGTASNSTDTARVSLGDKITVRDPETHRWIERRATRSDVERAQSASGGTSADTDEEAGNQARRQFRRAERRAIELSATIIGMPNLHADTTIRIEGIGERLSGNYYIKQAAHDVGNNGYTCALQLQRNAESGSSAGNQRGGVGRRQAQQRYLRVVAILDRQLAAGSITRAQYEAKKALAQRQRDATIADAGGNTSGQQNTSGARPAGEMQQVTYRDPETHRWRTRYVRRPTTTPTSPTATTGATGGSR